MRSTMRRGDRLVALVGNHGRDLDQRPLRLAEAGELRDVQLVEAEGPRHARVELEEERHVADERGDVLGVGPQADEAMAIGRRRRGDDQRAARGRPQQRGHLREVVGDEVAAAVPIGLARRRRQEVGDVAKVRCARAVQVGPVVQRMHLMQAHVLQALVVGLQHVDEGDGLAVGHRDDDVGAGRHVKEHVLGPPGARRRDGGGHVRELSREGSGRRRVNYGRGRAIATDAGALIA
jgi:hypothetical protein